MTEDRLREILDGFSKARILIVGDFFLDHYLIMDAGLEEVSLETGRPAHQVVEVRSSPGAAGTVAANLASLEVGSIRALGVRGDDGYGWELQRGLEARGVVCSDLLVTEEAMTPTYIKPMRREADGTEKETERQDIKNRCPLPAEMMEVVVKRLLALTPRVDGVIIADQVTERGCGVVTDGVRESLAYCASLYPRVRFLADSRARIGDFTGVMLKPNALELQRFAEPGSEECPDLESARAMGRRLQALKQQPVFLTLGEAGVAVLTDEGECHVPAVSVDGPIDIVGAGDAFCAGVMASLCAGASPAEAGTIGCLVASLTIQQLGTTGTTTRDAVVSRFASATAGGWQPP